MILTKNNKCRIAFRLKALLHSVRSPVCINCISMENRDSKIVKCSRLADRLKHLMSSLDFYDLHIHQHIDEFYYLTKLEELKILVSQYEVEKKKLDATMQLVDLKYIEVFHQWRKDARWLCSYQNDRNVRSQ